MPLIIREATAGDVQGVIRYMKEVVDEQGLYLGLEPGEFNPTVEEEIKWIEDHANAANSIILLAVETDTNRGKWDVDDGEIVGLMNCLGGTRQSAKHVTTLGITVKGGWRGQGIGTRLMRQALEWARETGVVKRVQLEVVEENAAARQLYERLGFEAEGVRRRAMWKQGRWMDSVMMALLV